MAFRGIVWHGEEYTEDATGRVFRVFGLELPEGAADEAGKWRVALELQGGEHSGASYWLPLDEFRRRHTAVHVCFRDDCRCGHMAVMHAEGGCFIDGCGCTGYQVWE